MSLTITDVAKAIKRKHGGTQVPDWKMRQVFDSLDESHAISVHRVGVYRAILDSEVEIVAAELRRLGWLKAEAVQ